MPGVLEWWSDGVLGKAGSLYPAFPHYSNTPVLHHSNLSNLTIALGFDNFLFDTNLK
jgi:hypothetical protein